MTPSQRPAPAPAKRDRRPPVITLLTDFGERDGFVGIVKGVLLQHCPAAQLVDLSHDLVPQDVFGGALVLASAVRHFPRGTVHLAVVDPGVGGARRPLLVETEEFSLVGPDNGLLSLAAGAAPRRVIHLDRPELFREAASHTFHARDVFAPVAGRLAAGIAAAELGSDGGDFERIVLPSPRRLDDGVEGQVIHVDRFGNLISNLRIDDLSAFRDRALSVSIRGVQIAEISTHYSAVREGKPLALWNSWGRLEVAIRNGSAARHLRARIGDRVVVAAQGRPR